MNTKRVRAMVFSELPIEDEHSIWIDTSQNYSFKIRYYKDGEWVPIETPITNEFIALMQLYSLETNNTILNIQEDLETVETGLSVLDTKVGDIDIVLDILNGDLDGDLDSIISEMEGV